MARTLPKWFGLVLAFSSLPLLGCSQNAGHSLPALSPSSSSEAATQIAKSDDEHAHKPSAHGGIVVPIGRDNYHAEAVFEKGGVLRLYMLGQDEAKVLEVQALPLTGYVKAASDPEAVSFVLRPDPQSGDADGKTSRFLAHLPGELVGKQLEVTIPSVRIGSERFRVGFQSVTASAHSESPTPSRATTESERKLYLTAGGLYTEADIKANGNTTASQKFAGIQARHDIEPRPGDKICPISQTKSNPQFTWIVGGKAYEFCCPPCADEFLTKAKETPSAIKDPDFYRKK